ncbi:MAG: hypothetical protein ABL901_16555 [Hyphomicrobiaceae bacterium]
MGLFRRRSDEGFVLIVVIWFAALLALLAIGFSSAVRANLRAASGAIQGAKAEALADAGVELAVLSLMAGAANRRFAINGSVQSCNMRGLGVVGLRIQDAGGRVSLNLASDRLLQALFIGLGAGLEDASILSDLIIDYRDAGDTRLPNGAERPEYLAAGRAGGPKNAPFDTVEEVYQVLGADPALLALAMPHLTVHSQTGGIDSRGVTRELATILVRGGDQLPMTAGAEVALSAGMPGEFITSSPQRVFWVSSEARLANGAAFVREVAVDLQSTQSVPRYMMWKRAPVLGEVTAGGAEVPLC